MTSELSLYNVAQYSLQIAILSAVAALLVWVFRLQVPRAQLAFWYAVLACCLLVPIVAPWYQPPIEPSAAITFSAAGDTLAQPLSGHRWTFSRGLGWAGAALLLLAAGTALRLILLGFGMLRLHRLRRHAEPVPPMRPLDRAVAATYTTAEFLRSEDVTGPVTFGFKRPVILIPPGFFALAEPEQESIAIHELLHVARRDWLWTLGEECVRALLWFHPAIWFLLNRVQLAREQTVDEAVVECTRRADDYVGALLKIARARMEPDLAPAPLFLRKRHLRERVAAIVKGANMSKSRLTLTMIAVLSMLPIAAGILAWQIPLHAAPQEVVDAAGVQVNNDFGPFKLLHRNPVEYPVEARENAVSGDVVASLSVNSQGEVTDARILSGPQDLRAAVLKSVLGWHFADDAHKLPASFQVAVRFDMAGAVPVPNPRPQIASAGAQKSFTVDQIDLSALPENLRDRVQQAMPVAAGDAITYERFQEIERALKTVDRHLSLRPSMKDNRAVLHVVLPGSEPLAPSKFKPNAQRIRVGGNVEAANLVTKVTPSYPPEAKQARIQGIVHLQALIGKDGHVLELELISGDPLLVPTSIESVKQWVYKPVLLNGNPVEVITQIDINYTLAP